MIAWLTLGLVSDKFSYITKRFEYFFTTDKEKIEEALEALRNGEIILVTDDPDRENDGKLHKL